jgi:hypothetical protein
MKILLIILYQIKKMTKMKNIVDLLMTGFLIMNILPNFTKQDLPVHCLKHEVNNKYI